MDGLDEAGLDAPAGETQDTCHGHPNDVNNYHYHSVSPCLLTNADLDECHGRTSRVPWHGGVQNIYHYAATFEFPYLVGCFRGTVSSP